MQNLIGAFSGFSVEEDALIGRAVRAFALLERSLGELANAQAQVASSPAVANPEHKHAKEHASRLGSSIAEHAKAILADRVEVARCLAIPQELVVQFADDLANLGRWRNLVCHGVLQHEGDALLRCTLWSREAIKLLRMHSQTHEVLPDSECLSFGELNLLVEETLSAVENASSMTNAMRQVLVLPKDHEISTPNYS